MMLSMLLIAGALFNLAGYALYGLAIKRGLVEPNRASWLIWSAALICEALTYQAINQGAAQNAIFLLSSIACIIVTLAVWRYSTWQRPSTTELVCVAACLAGLILWAGFGHARWAHALVLATIPVSFIPTWLSARAAPEREASPAWGFWAIGDLATLFFIAASSTGSMEELSYVILELVCHANVWMMVGLRSINPARSFTLINGRLMTRTVEKTTGAAFLLGCNRKGKAVFAGQSYRGGQRIMQFTGTIHRRAEIPARLRGAADRYVQVGHDCFMGPSGNVDDLINHSCDPNAGLMFDEQDIFLCAVRDIELGEELCWDYSTTCLDHAWSIRCHCEAENCRRDIGEFIHLPISTMLRYRALSVLPGYICDAMDRKLSLSNVLPMQRYARA
jgi:hypothetical protein